MPTPVLDARDTVLFRANHQDPEGPRDLLLPWSRLARDRGRRRPVGCNQKQLMRLGIERHGPGARFGSHRIDDSEFVP